MKKIVLFLGLGFYAIAGFAQLQVNPQVGMNFMSFSNAPEGTEFKADIGYSIGADLRFGERFQFQPGAHWFHSTTTAEAVGGDVTSDVVHQYIKIKAMGAFNLIDGGGFKLRVNVGPTYDILVNVDNEFLEKDDFSSGVFNIQGGVGVDFLFLTAELGYAQGLNNTFDFDDAPDSKTSGLYFTVGIILGDGKD